MESLPSDIKRHVQARIVAFPGTGLAFKPSPAIVNHHKSFHGKDFKQWAQMSLFILWPYLDVQSKRLWLALSKVILTHNNKHSLSIIMHA